MTSINAMSFNRIQQNPEQYAQQYATENGISISEAREELRTQYGDPSQMASGSIFDFGNTQDSTYNYDNYLEEYETDTENSASTNIQDILQKIMDFIKGGNGPQQEGDPEHHKNSNSFSAEGPQKEGDPELHKYNDSSFVEGPQKEGDPQPHLNNNYFENFNTNSLEELNFFI